MDIPENFNKSLLQDVVCVLVRKDNSPDMPVEPFLVLGDEFTEGLVPALRIL
jgi:hypothetical protein